ncbi:MAG: hypothetical protein K1X53_02525 [Candidatus Sumerlaeaceae bacterium]|nr:hypothetical protein [Candidatus Sumerlaeaceae bacterium]
MVLCLRLVVVSVKQNPDGGFRVPGTHPGPMGGSGWASGLFVMSKNNARSTGPAPLPYVFQPVVAGLGVRAI